MEQLYSEPIIKKVYICFTKLNLEEGSEHANESDKNEKKSGGGSERGSVGRTVGTHSRNRNDGSARSRDGGRGRDRSRLRGKDLIRGGIIALEGELGVGDSIEASEKVSLISSTNSVGHVGEGLSRSTDAARASDESSKGGVIALGNAHVEASNLRVVARSRAQVDAATNTINLGDVKIDGSGQRRGEGAAHLTTIRGVFVGSSQRNNREESDQSEARLHGVDMRAVF